MTIRRSEAGNSCLYNTVVARRLILVLGITLTMMYAEYSTAIGWFGNTLDGTPCVGKEQGYGPFDYTNPVHRREKYPIVQSAHFPRHVEMLIRGNRGSIEGDLDYTLRAFPNHHRALYAYIKYYFKKKRNLKNPPECYLIRAEKYKPDDSAVYALHGYYLHRMRRYEEAKSKYRKAISLQQDNAEYHYNYGLLLLDSGDIDGARKQAEIAERLGFPLHGLQQKLKEVTGDN